MSRFVQLHLLTSYPPSNLNRDDTGRPKTALVGDANRLRISSQSLKRAWRTSENFEAALGGNLGTRTKQMGKEIYKKLLAGGLPEKVAREWAKNITKQFGNLKSEKKTDNDVDLEIEQLAHFSPDEQDAIHALITRLIDCQGALPGPDAESALLLLCRPRRAVDIAMFGRMLANAAEFNMEAAVQVAHAITVHRAAVEDDYFSAVDDLQPLGDTGAAHIGERGYGAGLFYLYLCIDRTLLKANLGDDEALAARALDALVHAITQVAPTGMQNSFASRAYASYVLAEKGNQQPRSLAQAFLKPVKPRAEEGMLDLAVKALESRNQNFDAVYGACADARYVMNVETPAGSLAELARFVVE